MVNWIKFIPALVWFARHTFYSTQKVWVLYQIGMKFILHFLQWGSKTTHDLLSGSISISFCLKLPSAMNTGVSEFIILNSLIQMSINFEFIILNSLIQMSINLFPGSFDCSWIPHPLNRLFPSCCLFFLSSWSKLLKTLLTEKVTSSGSFPIVTVTAVPSGLAYHLGYS